MILVNLFGGPGSGKSTMAAALFAKLKTDGVKVELVGEEAKDLVFNHALELLDNQVLVTALQYQRVLRLQKAGATVAISDSPLGLGRFYSKGKPYEKELVALISALEAGFPATVDFFVQRVKPYQKFGRLQTEDEAKAIDNELHKLVPTAIKVLGNEQGTQAVYNYITWRMDGSSSR